MIQHLMHYKADLHLPYELKITSDHKFLHQTKPIFNMAYPMTSVVTDNGLQPSPSFILASTGDWFCVMLER